MIDFKLNSKIDGFLGILIGSLISMSVFFGALVMTVESYLIPNSLDLPWQRAFLIGVLIWASITEWWFIITSLISLIRNRHPLGLAIAILQPIAPLIFRPLIALWWLFHALIGIVFGIAVIIINLHASWYGHLLVTIITGAFAYMAYVFVLLSVTAFTKSPSMLVRTWKLRAWWGGLACLITLLIPLTVR